MDLTNSSAVVTGGASGLGLATVEALVARGVAVTIVDLPQSPGKDVASRLGDEAALEINRAAYAAIRAFALAANSCAIASTRVQLVNS